MMVKGRISLMQLLNGDRPIVHSLTKQDLWLDSFGYGGSLTNHRGIYINCQYYHILPQNDPNEFDKKKSKPKGLEVKS